MVKTSTFLSARAASKLLGASDGFILRSIEAGELPATKRNGTTAAWTIARSDVVAFAQARGIALVGADGSRVDPSTGEVLGEHQPPAAAAAPEPEPVAAEPEPEPVQDVQAAAPQAIPDDQVRGRLESARALLALPESPQLWQALRAVLEARA